MAFLLKQSTASQEIPLGPFVDSTDGVTAKTGLTIANTDIKLWFSGGTSESSKNSGGATHIANGRYYAVLDATDTATLGPMRASVAVSGALPVWLDCLVLPVTVYDAVVTNAVNTTGGLPAATATISAVAGYLGSSGAAVNGINANTLASHDPGATLGTGTSTLTQAQVTGGAYALQTDASGYAKLSSGTGTGQVSLSSGAVLLQPTQTGVTIPNVTNLTNAPTSGDLTATMKASVTTAATAATPIAASVAGAVGSVTGAVGSVTGAVGSVTGNVGGSVTGNVGGSVTGSVGSVATGGIVAASFAANAINAAAIATDAIDGDSIKADAVTKIQAGLSTYAGTDTSGTTALLARLTATRAGYLDNLTALDVAISTATAAILASVAGLNNLSAAGVRAAVGLTSANLDTQLDALPTNAELATALAAADDAVLAAIAALNNLSSVQAQAAAAAALTAYDPPTDAEMIARTLAAASYATSTQATNIQGRLPASLNGDGLMRVDVIQYAGTPQSNGDLPLKIDSIITVTNQLADTLEYADDAYRFTNTALSQAPIGSGGDAPTVTEIRQEMDANSTKLASIKAQTDQFTFDGSRVLASADVALTEDNVQDIGAAVGEVIGEQLDEIQAHTDLIGPGVITAVYPLSPDGKVMSIIRGNDYFLAQGRRFEWTSANWPDLTDATIVFKSKYVETAGVVISATAVGVEFTRVQTRAMNPTASSTEFEVQAHFGNTAVVTLIQGTINLS